VTDNNDPFRGGCAWINGQFVPAREATISIFDSGFTRSDVTYDVVGVWGGKFFRLDDHLDRFLRSLERQHLTIPFDRDGLRGVLNECVARSGLTESYVDMICSRGLTRSGSRRLTEHENRFYAYAIPYQWIVPEEQQALGTDLVIARLSHRIPPESVDPTVKNFHWGDFVRGQFEVLDRTNVQVVLPDAEGRITEGPGFNVFALVNREWITPDRGVLEGVSRRAVLDVAADLGVPARLGVLTVADMGVAEEAFLTSTAGGVMPVVSIDGRVLGDGTPGPSTTRLRDAYWAAHDDPRWTTPVDYGVAEA
jgi:branched-chain amino acid aminotransferase